MSSGCTINGLWGCSGCCLVVDFWLLVGDWSKVIVIHSTRYMREFLQNRGRWWYSEGVPDHSGFGTAHVRSRFGPLCSELKPVQFCKFPQVGLQQFSLIGCVHTYMHIYVHTHLCIHVYIHIDAYTYIQTYTYVNVYVDVVYKDRQLNR